MSEFRPLSRPIGFLAWKISELIDWYGYHVMSHPVAATSRQWRRINHFDKAKGGLRYYTSVFLHFVQRQFNRLHSFAQDVENVLWYRYNVIKIRSLGPGWCDRVQLIPEFLFQQLVDYVEQEDCFNVIVWDSDPEHEKMAKEIRAIYSWITVDYPKLKKELEAKYSWVASELLENHITDYCQRIIKIRRVLWT